MEEDTLTLKERLLGLAEFLPFFEDPKFSFGHWDESKELSPDVIEIPCYSFSSVASEFIKVAYDLGWVIIGFDWPDWKETSEAKDFASDIRTISRATPEQLAKLLTVVIRQDRFCEGAIANAFECGFLTAVCRRAAQLASETEGEEL